MTNEDVSRILEKVWPDWYVVGEIGKGSYGKVYRIEKNDDGNMFTAALKVVSINEETFPDESGLDLDDLEKTGFYEEQTRKLMNEYNLMSKFKGTSHIVSYEDHHRLPHPSGVGSIILIRMELLSSLKQYFTGETIKRQELIKMGIHICEALELCDKEEVIHRDIKPDNIFVSKFGDYKLGDFSVARTIEESQGARSKQGNRLYMAPEVYNGMSDYGKTVDQYSLGLVMYGYMNRNTPPFIEGKVDSKSALDALNKRFGGEPLPLPSCEKGPLAEAVVKACSFDPKDRYASAADFKKVLQKLVDVDDETEYPIKRSVKAFTSSMTASKIAATITAELSSVQETGEPGDSSGAAGKAIEKVSNEADAVNKLAETELMISKLSKTQVMSSLAETQVMSDLSKTGVMINGQSGVVSSEGDTLDNLAKTGIMAAAASQSVQHSANPEEGEDALGQLAKTGIMAGGVSSASAASTGDWKQLDFDDMSSKGKKKKDGNSSGKSRKKLLFVLPAVLLAAIILAVGLDGKDEPEVPVKEETPEPVSVASVPEPETKPAEPEVPKEEPKVTYEWSEWAETIPDEVNDENSVIQSRTQYRSVELLYCNSKKQVPAGYTVLREDYSGWSAWSGWSSKKAAKSDLCQVETSVTYQYRDLVPVDVVTKGITVTHYNWTEWKTSSKKVTANSNREVNEIYSYRSRTRTVRYCAVDENGWSEYQDEMIKPGSDHLIDTRKLYRYIPREGCDAKEPSINNFTPAAGDYSGCFADVENNAWYGTDNSSAIPFCFEMGVLTADKYMYFYPKGEITIGEVLKAAAYINRIYNGVDGIVKEDEADAASVYVQYAIKNDIVKYGEFSDYTKAATRAETAYILANAMPENEFAQKNTVGEITDFTADSPYYSAVKLLAEAGVFSWENPVGEFNPDKTITRAEVATIIERMAFPDSR